MNKVKLVTDFNGLVECIFGFYLVTVNHRTKFVLDFTYKETRTHELQLREGKKLQQISVLFYKANCDTKSVVVLSEDLQQWLICCSAPNGVNYQTFQSPKLP